MTPYINQTKWEVQQPLATHFRVVTCKEAECPHWLMGWKTLIDESSQFGQAQAHYIRRESGRRFTEAKDEGGLTVFTFPPGQQCFRQHRKALERDAVFRKNGHEMWGPDWMDDNKETLYRIGQKTQEG